jgi:hypothetical protein
VGVLEGLGCLKKIANNYGNEKCHAKRELNHSIETQPRFWITVFLIFVKLMIFVDIIQTFSV